MFFGRTDAEVEAPKLWLPDAKCWLIVKYSNAGRDWGQEEKGTTEDEMAGWHHRLDGCEFEWTPGVGDGQGGLACCNSRGLKGSDRTERLNWVICCLLTTTYWKFLTATDFLNVFQFLNPSANNYLLHSMCTCTELSRFSRVWLFATLWTVSCQVSLSLEFSKQEYWSGLPCPPSGDLPDPGSKLCLLCLLYWEVGSLQLVPPRKPCYILRMWQMLLTDELFFWAK